MSSLNRRDLIQLAAIGATAIGAGSAEAAPVKSAARSARFEPLPLGAVKPAGWLALQLDKQAKGVTSNLQNLYHPFNGWAWEEDRPDPSGEWWPWEVRGYWADGTLRCGILTGDQALIDVAGRLVRRAFAQAAPDGYIGPGFLRKQGDVFRWPHVTFFRAAMALHDLTGDASIVEGIRRHYLGSPFRYELDRDACNIEAMLWAWERSGDARLLDLARTTWTANQAYEQRVAGGAPLTEAGMADHLLVPDVHGVTYAEFTKLPALLFGATGERRMLDLSIAAQDKVLERHLLPGGAPSSTENLSTVTARDAHEVCDVIDYSWTWGYLMAASGQGRWGDAIERATFNALPGSIRKDWSALQYYSSPNQCLCTATSDHLALMKGVPGWSIEKYRYMQRMSFRPSPGYIVYCCPANLSRALPNYVSRMWMEDRAGHGLAATLYGPGKLVWRGTEIVTETDYPYSEDITFRINPGAPAGFPLHLRIPGWAKGARLTLNGRPLALPAIRDGFATIARTWRRGDVLRLTLPMETTASTWPEDGVAIEHGPLVYALPIDAEWKTVPDDKSSARFPAWDATPRSDWAYTLLPDTKERKPVFTAGTPGTDPWTDPPHHIEVAARAVKGWDLVDARVGKDTVKLTPRLPDPAQLPGLAEGPVRTIKLVPMASTELRVTVFPRLKVDDA